MRNFLILFIALVSCHVSKQDLSHNKNLGAKYQQIKDSERWNSHCISNSNDKGSIQVLLAENACLGGYQINELSADNLILDGSFAMNKEGKNPIWKTASRGTPDFLENKIGLYMYSCLNENNREYIIAPLKDTLSPCFEYHLSFNIKKSVAYSFVVDRIEVAFVNQDYYQNNRSLIEIEPDFRSPESSLIMNEDGWIELCGSFIPESIATHIIIGNFSSDNETKIYNTDPSKDRLPYAYYLVDEIRLDKIDAIPNCSYITEEERNIDIVNFEEASFFSDTLLVFFETSESKPIVIDEEVFFDFRETLEKDSSLLVVVKGHTDNTGNDEINEPLSKRRAEYVANYMKNLGIQEGKIIVQSFGSKKARRANQGKAGKSENRRVEIYLVD